MRSYLRAFVLSAAMVSTGISTGVIAQTNQQHNGAVTSAKPVQTNLTPGFGAGKPYVNTELQRSNIAIQKEMENLVQSGKIDAANKEYSAPLRAVITDKAKAKDFNQLNKLSQGIVVDSLSDMQKQKRIEPVDPEKKKSEETPEPITSLTPSMRKSGNDDTAIMAELSDGQHVVFRNNGSVMIMNERGRAILPPDGVLTLKDGTTFNIKDGMRTE